MEFCFFVLYSRFFKIDYGHHLFDLRFVNDAASCWMILKPNNPNRKSDLSLNILFDLFLRIHIICNFFSENRTCLKNILRSARKNIFGKNNKIYLKMK